MKTTHFILLLFCFIFFKVESKISQYKSDTSEVVAPKMRVGIYLEPPFILYDLDSSVYGISMELWKYIALQNEIEYEIIKYDHILEIFYDLINGHLDICINPLVVSSTRLRQLEFSQPFFISSLGISVKRNTRNPITIFFSNIFSLEFAELMLLLITIVFMFGTLVWIIEKNNDNKDFRHGFHGILDGVWWSTVTVTTVGYGDKTPKTTLGRVISMVWMFSAITLISSFTATVTSSLTIKSLDFDINGIESIKKLGKIGAVENSTAYDYLSKAQIKTSKVFDTSENALIALRDEKIDAFIHDKSIMKYLVQENPTFNSEIEILTFSFEKQYFSFATPKGSFISNKINPPLVDRIGHKQWSDVLKRYNLQDLQ